MLWSGSSPVAVVRAGMWGFLLFAGVAWLAIAWSVLRLEPTDVVHVAGPVILFGALTEAVRALAGTKTWWLNAGMAVLFAVTGVLLLTDQGSSYTTPAALIGWYLMVRGAADIAVSMMTRETDRIWGLLMVVGVLEAGLGFFTASPLARTADLVVTVLGGLALARGVADLVASLRLREVGVADADAPALPPERAAGVAGYSAALTDHESSPVRTGPRHRAASKSSWGSWSAAEVSARPAQGGDATADAGPSSFHDEVLRASADLDTMLALAGVTGAAVGAGLAEHYEIPEIPDTPEGLELSDTAEIKAVGDDEDADAWPDPGARTAPEDTGIIAGGRLIE
jgi:hypothetical protein